MRQRTGQAAAEVITITLIVIALVLVLVANGAFAWLPGLAARAFGDDDHPPAPPSAIAYLDRAVASADGAGPPLRDAILRVAQVVGPERARALAVDRLLRRYAIALGSRREALADPSWALANPRFDGLGPATAAVWSHEEPRAPSTVRIVDRRAEQAWWQRQRPSTPSRVVSLGTAAVVGAATAVAPVLSLPVALIDATAAALGPTGAGIPAGSREDDAVICRFVWRRNIAEAGWGPAHAIAAGRLQLGQRVPAVELTIIRAGQIEAHVVVRSHATTC